jgi:hypothetical protein
MVIPFLGFQKSRFFANKTHNYEQLVLVELSTCDVDVEGKLEIKSTKFHSLLNLYDFSIRIHDPTT